MEDFVYTDIYLNYHFFAGNNVFDSACELKNVCTFLFQKIISSVNYTYQWF